MLLVEGERSGTGSAAIKVLTETTRTRHIVRRIQIDCEPLEVFDLLTNLGRRSDWATGTTGMHHVPNGPLREGQTFQQTIRVAGRNVEFEWHVADMQPPHRIVYEAKGSGGAQLVVRQTVIPIEGGSRVELELDYQLGGTALGGPINRTYFERRFEREIACSLHNLRDLLECGLGS